MNIDSDIMILYLLVMLTILDSVLGQLNIKSTTMKIVTNSSGPLCATDQPSAVYNVRSAIDCQQKCTTSASTCHFANFYGDKKRCETFQYFPNNFAKDVSNCVLYRNHGPPDNSIISQFTYLPAAGKFYKALLNVSDWFTAVKRCQQFGPRSHLVAIETWSEYWAVSSYMTATYGSQCGGFWLSGFRTTDQPTCVDSYYWAIDGLTSAPMTISRWSTNSDPGCGQEACVIALYSGWVWIDTRCWYQYCAMCELELV